VAKRALAMLVGIRKAIYPGAVWHAILHVRHAVALLLAESIARSAQSFLKVVLVNFLDLG
jgi:hypothetical protein